MADAPTVFLASYRGTAATKVLILFIGYIPCMVLLACLIARPHLYRRYRTSVVPTVFGVAVTTLPQFVFNAVISIMLSQDVPTTVRICGTLKQITDKSTLGGFGVLPGVAVYRYLLLVWSCNVGMVGIVLLSVAFGAPQMVVGIFESLTGEPQDYDVCAVTLIFASRTLRQCCNSYTVISFFVSIAFNLRVFFFLISHSKEKERQGMSATNERAVSVSLLVQSVVPLTTIGAYCVSNAIYIADSSIDMPSALVLTLDLMSYATPGANAIATILTLPSFQRALLSLRHGLSPNTVASVSNSNRQKPSQVVPSTLQ